MQINFSAIKDITLNPPWSKQDFTLRAWQISQQLQQQQVRSLGLWLDDAAQMACVLLACFQAKVRVLLPPNLLAENQQWLARENAMLMDNERVATFGLEQQVEAETLAQPLIDPDCQSEIWIKTSGSSGEPKVLIKTAKKMWQEAQAIADTIKFSADRPLYVVSSVSAQHHYGLSYRIFLPLYLGWSIARLQYHYPEYLMSESLQVEKVLWVSSPALLTHLNLKDTKLARCGIRAVISAGSPLPSETAQRIHDVLGCRMIECYGSTETGAIAFREQETLWTPTVVTEVGLTENETLWVNSPWLDEPEIMADMVQMHGERFLLLGRTDRIVKLGDKRISLVNIEQALQQHSWVIDCFVAKHPNQARPAAWVALTEEGLKVYRTQGRNAVIHSLRQHLSQNQEAVGLPRFWRFTDKLPRNSQSKILNADFEQAFLSQQEEFANE
ncbi:AMP-binding protein [Avibacterium sp. 20-126]|uniref:AMP-binding protein n=1 Tax=Avibacterium sp. 20-126 TaxID=2911524 RepID=UPI00218A5870|nr:AMP-binding protein [Avibacterium sp. 20-126]